MGKPDPCGGEITDVDINRILCVQCSVTGIRPPGTAGIHVPSNPSPRDLNLA